MENDSICPFNTNSNHSSSNDQDYNDSQHFQNGFISRQFDVLDEVSEDKNSGSENDSDDSDSYDSEVPDEEIEAMLEEGLPEEFRAKKRRKLGDNLEEGQKPYEERDKTVLIEKGQNHFDVLPEGWIQVTHNSGMPLYLHKTTRVCTLAKPYFLGPGSVRKHQIPLSAVPCLSYQKALKEESNKIKNEAESEAEVSGLNLPNARIETVQENLETHSLSPSHLREYCEKRFHFKTIKVVNQQINNFLFFNRRFRQK